MGEKERMVRESEIRDLFGRVGAYKLHEGGLS